MDDTETRRKELIKALSAEIQALSGRLEVLDLLADIASIHWLEDLPPYEEAALGDRIHSVFGRLMMPLEKERRGYSTTSTREILDRLHKIMRRVVVPLVDDGYVNLDVPLRGLELDEPRLEWQAIVRNGVVAINSVWGISEPKPRQLYTDWITPLFHELVLPGVPFRFARCPQCKRVFLPGKNQRFCSANCQTAANREHRREYMREYLKDRRRKGSAKRAKSSRKVKGTL